MPAGVAMLLFVLIGGTSIRLLCVPSVVMLLWPQAQAIGLNE